MVLTSAGRTAYYLVDMSVEQMVDVWAVVWAKQQAASKAELWVGQKEKMLVDKTVA